jgi:hypothetical protein
MFQKKFVEKITTHFFVFSTLFPKIVPFKKNMVQPYRVQMTIWRMHIA